MGLHLVRRLPRQHTTLDPRRRARQAPARRGAATLLLAGLLQAGLAGAAAAAEGTTPQEGATATMNPPISVGTQKQLFIDRRFIESSQGMALTMNPAQRTGERILEADRPWEVGGLDFAFNVLQEGDTFRMWYCACTEFGKEWRCKIFYAQSKDGLHWEKPELGLLEIGGSKANNCVFEGPHGSASGQTVFRDPSAPPAERYKMIYGDFGAPAGAPLLGAYSADGIHWTGYPQQIIPQGCDTQDVVFYDARLGKYVAYTRHNVRPPERQGIRRVARTESSDFQKLPMGTVVFHADEGDPPGTGAYNMATTPYPYAQDVYLGFPSFFPGEIAGGSQLLDIHLAVSRDGSRWERPARQPFLPLGLEGSFDSKMAFVTPGICRVGDELWLYYSGYTIDHATITPLRPTTAVYSRARLRLDGFVSADAGVEGGTLTTPPLIFAGKHLQIGVDQGSLGSVTVALLDGAGQALPGFAAQDMDVCRGNQAAHTVAWKGNSDLSAWAGKPVKLQFSLRQAKLYAFQFVGE
jgi:hypothetical protein